MSDWVMLTTIACNVLVIVGAWITLFVRFGKWDQKMTDMYESIKDVQLILSEQAKCIKEHEGRISYLEGQGDIKK